MAVCKDLKAVAAAEPLKKGIYFENVGMLCFILKDQNTKDKIDRGGVV